MGTGPNSFSLLAVKAIDFPDGRTLYPDLGFLAQPGESLQEAINRQKRLRVAELFHQAMIPAAFTEWTLNTFASNSREKRRALEAARNYAEKVVRGNLILVGLTGVGKTGLAIGILRARLEQGVPSLFVSVPDLLDKIRATFAGHGDYTSLMDTVKTLDFLVLDDLGAHYATEWAREKLFQLLGYRHDWLLPTVITSDRPLAELESAIGRRTLARIVEHGKIVEVGGRDLRK